MSKETMNRPVSKIYESSTSASVQIADDVVVMDKGRIIEEGPIHKIINKPQHKHTKYLIDTRFKLIRRFQEVLA